MNRSIPHIAKPVPAFDFRPALLAALLCLLLAGTAVAGDTANRLLKVELRPGNGATRLLFKFSQPVEYTASPLVDRGFRLRFHDTDGPLYRKFRNYRDPRVGGLVFARQNGRLSVTIPLAGGMVAQVMPPVSPTVVTVNVASSGGGGASSPPACRERVWQGAGEIVAGFRPPRRSEVPFVPTRRENLPEGLSEQEIGLVLVGEGDIYKGNATDAESIFGYFLDRQPAIKALSAYRLGEARHLLGKYREAVAAFRIGEKLWPDYLANVTSVGYAYADSLARAGEPEQGRAMLIRMARNGSDRKFAPFLLLRIAELAGELDRSGDSLAIYRTLAESFPESRAAFEAELKLADREFFRVGPLAYIGLLRAYERIRMAAPDPAIREEACFKVALLEAMNGPAVDAMALVTLYERRYGGGTYISVAGTLHEEIMHCLYRDLSGKEDWEGLVKAVSENRNYLARCLQDPEFLPRLAGSCDRLGQARQKLDLYVFLAGREWAASRLDILLEGIVETAVQEGDYPLAENAARDFLHRFPRHPSGGRVGERLAAICFSRKENNEVANLLGGLLKGRSATFAESWFYLGEALAAANRRKESESAMIAYISRAKDDPAAHPFLADTCFSVISSRIDRNDLKGALALSMESQRLLSGKGKEMALYKSGEVLRLLGKEEDARQNWETLARQGNDPVWKKLAVQGVADLDWKRKMSGGPP